MAAANSANMSVPSAHFSHFPHASIDEWKPALAPGELRTIYLHWSGGTYSDAYASYHYCIAWDGNRIYVAQTNDLRGNTRDVYGSEAPYAAHTYRRNSHSAGLCVLGMKNAVPDDFGAYPLRMDMVNGLCHVAASLARAYGIPVDAAHVRTHAEAAIDDGYFGAQGDDVRWDIARLYPSSLPLTEEEGKATAAILRERIATYV
jgi:hypothetical protein